MSQSQGQPQLIHQGLLRKSPPEGKIEKNYKWHKRYFKLWSNQMLEYYKKEHDKTPLKEPLALASCEEITAQNDEMKKYLSNTNYIYPFCLKMPNRLFYMAAASDSDRSLWIRKLRAICNGEVDVSPIPASGMEKRHESIASRISGRSATASSSSRTSIKSSGDDDNLRNRLYSHSSTDTEEPGSLNNTRSLQTYDHVSPIPRPVGDYDVPPVRSPTAFASEVYDVPPARRKSKVTPSSPTSSKSRSSTISYRKSSEPFSPISLIHRNINYDEPTSNKRIQSDDAYPEMNIDDSTHVILDYNPSDRPTVRPARPSIKQPPTKSKNNDGYEQMGSVEDDYVPSSGPVTQKPYSSREDMEFRGPKIPTPLKPVLPKAPNGSSHTFPYGISSSTSLIEETIMDEIPNIENKSREEVKRKQAYDSTGPEVNRGNKPSPGIDRSKKPGLPKQKTYVCENNRTNHFQTNKAATFDSSHSQYSGRRARHNIESDYVQHDIKPINNNTLPNHFVASPTKSSAEPSYFNDKMIQKSNMIVQDEDLYCNLDERIPSGSAKSTVNNASSNMHQRHINNTTTAHTFALDSIDYYKTADLPEVPPSMDKSLDPYENIKARQSSDSHSITYIEVSGTAWPDAVFETSHDNNDVTVKDGSSDESMDSGEEVEEDRHMEVIGESKDGSHYVFVDPVRTEALQKLQKR